MIEKVNHYSMSTPASIYDEEALTALELVARLGAKCNEVIENVNKQDKKIEQLFTQELKKFVNEWLDKHPEATTTVLDGSLTEPKFHESLKQKAIKDYVTPQMYGAVADGVADDTEALQMAIDNAKVLGGLYIPEGVYKINQRVTLSNAENMVIMNRGVIKPIDGVTPLIGTITLEHVRNTVIYGLCFDGNIENVPEAETVGLQSLLRVAYCDNLVFDNLEIRNAGENGVTGEANNNITFRNCIFENIGEHCFYFGGKASHNMNFENLKVKNIGQNKPSEDRVTAVVKFRLHDVSDELNTNIRINGFEFTDTSPLEVYQCYNCLACLMDTINFDIRNGAIDGDVCSVLQLNMTLDSGLVENVKFRGRDLCCGVGKGYGANTPTDIPVYGRFEVLFRNCYIEGATNFFSYFDYEKCMIKPVLAYLNTIYGCMDARKKQTLKDCAIDIYGASRINVNMVDEIHLIGCFIKSEANQNHGIFHASKDCKIVLTRYDSSRNRSFLVRSDGHNIQLICDNSVVDGKIIEAKKVQITNCEVGSGFDSWIDIEDAHYSNVIRLSDRKRLDTAIIRKDTYNDSVAVDFRYNCVKKLTKDNVCVIPKTPGNFTYTVNNNFVSIENALVGGTFNSFEVVVF